MKQNSRSFMIALILFSALLLGQLVTAQTVMERAGNRPDRNFKIPVILDGVEYPAGELPNTDAARFYVLTREDQEKGVVHAFSSNDRAAAFIRFTMAKNQRNDDSEQQGMAASSCQHPYNYSYFNKDRFGGGSHNLFMDKDPGTSYPERHLNLDFNGWNNTISYVEAACNGLWTTLYSCRNFQLFQDTFCEDPDALAIQPGVVIPDLVPYGFNNRTSSIQFLQLQ